MQIFIEMLVKLCVKNSIEFEHVWSCVTWIEPKALGQYTCTCLQVTHLRTLTTGSDDLWVTSTPHLLSILCTSTLSNALSNAPRWLQYWHCLHSTSSQGTMTYFPLSCSFWANSLLQQVYCALWGLHKQVYATFCIQMTFLWCILWHYAKLPMNLSQLGAWILWHPGPGQQPRL